MEPRCSRTHGRGVGGLQAPIPSVPCGDLLGDLGPEPNVRLRLGEKRPDLSSISLRLPVRVVHVSELPRPMPPVPGIPSADSVFSAGCNYGGFPLGNDLGSLQHAPATSAHKDLRSGVLGSTVWPSLCRCPSLVAPLVARPNSFEKMMLTSTGHEPAG